MAKRTIRRRARKNRTIRKVMRGCNRRRMKKGGATAPPGTAPPGTIQTHSYSTAGEGPNAVNAKLTQHAAAAHALSQNPARPIPPPTQSSMAGGISTNGANAPAAKGMQGGARTRYRRRRLRYKKSMARKSRRA